MSMRTSYEFLEQQNQRRKQLLEEGIMGITERDTLPNKSFPLVKESEVMYFKNAREFLKTTFAYIIMHSNQDI